MVVVVVVVGRYEVLTMSIAEAEHKPRAIDKFRHLRYKGTYLNLPAC